MVGCARWRKSTKAGERRKTAEAPGKGAETGFPGAGMLRSDISWLLVTTIPF